MNIRDYEKFTEVIVGFAELKGKQLSPAAVELYWRAMQHWPIDEFRRAAEHLLRTCAFMPTPKDFEDLRKAGRETAAEAWERARRFADSLYSPTGYRDGEIGDYAIDMAVQSLGGYPAIAMCDVDKLHFLERRFAERFEELSDAEETRNRLPQIASPQRAGSTLRLRTGGLKRLGELSPKALLADVVEELAHDET